MIFIRENEFMTMSEMGNYSRLGNQMFQYAFMKNISLLLNLPIRLRTLNKGEYYKIRLNECFKLPVSATSNVEYPFDHKEENVYECREGDNMEYQERMIEELKNVKNKIININGYFQSEKYFKTIKHELFKDFQFNDQIENKSLNFINSLLDKYDRLTALHVRRGDIVNNTNVYPVITEKYIKNAINYMNSKVNNIKIETKNDITEIEIKQSNNLFLIFSDDHNYCQTELKLILDNLNIQYLLVKDIGNKEDCEKNEYIDLCIMSKCHHFITSCSSYSFWGAYLSNNKGKIIISPKPWFNINHPDGKRLCSQDKDIIPEEWIRFDLY